jgi:hypothetical protein
MTTIAFRSDESLRGKLEHLAKYKGINLSALIKLYLTKAVKTDLSEVTENGITVAQELEILAAQADGTHGKAYSDVKEFIGDLDRNVNDNKNRGKA